MKIVHAQEVLQEIIDATHIQDYIKPILVTKDGGLTAKTVFEPVDGIKYTISVQRHDNG